MAATGTSTRTCKGLALAGLAAYALSGCGTTQSTRPLQYDLPNAQAVSDARQNVVLVAAEQIGTPYRYGGSNQRGFDCSGLVQYAHRAAGVDVPRTTTAQWSVARTPARRHLLPGDLLFFRIDEKKPSHVGIYEGHGVFIHAPSSGKEVSRASLDDPYWQNRLIGTKSFL